MFWQDPRKVLLNPSYKVHAEREGFLPHRKVDGWFWIFCRMSLRQFKAWTWTVSVSFLFYFLQSSNYLTSPSCLWHFAICRRWLFLSFLPCLSNGSRSWETWIMSLSAVVVDVVVVADRLWHLFRCDLGGAFVHSAKVEKNQPWP